MQHLEKAFDDLQIKMDNGQIKSKIFQGGVDVTDMTEEEIEAVKKRLDAEMIARRKKRPKIPTIEERKQMYLAQGTLIGNGVYMFDTSELTETLVKGSYWVPQFLIQLGYVMFRYPDIGRATINSDAFDKDELELTDIAHTTFILPFWFSRPNSEGIETIFQASKEFHKQPIIEQLVGYWEIVLQHGIRKVVHCPDTGVQQLQVELYDARMFDANGKPATEVDRFAYKAFRSAGEQLRHFDSVRFLWFWQDLHDFQWPRLKSKVERENRLLGKCYLPNRYVCDSWAKRNEKSWPELKHFKHLSDNAG
ncbi:MAG: hypothetical protein CMP20_10355 [Rickettsiales bacterium]|nr:hypothetical protein [Rickettsiales bacterium]